MPFDPRIYDASPRADTVGPRRLEHRAQLLADLLPACEIMRTTEVIQVSCGRQEGIVVLVTAEAFEFRLPSIEWTYGTYGPALTSRVWRRVQAENIEPAELRDVIEEAMQARQREFSVCTFCGERVAVEHRHGDTCHSCAERHLGVVH